MNQLIVKKYIDTLDTISNKTKSPIKPTDFLRECQHQQEAARAFVQWQAAKSAKLRNL